MMEYSTEDLYKRQNSYESYQTALHALNIANNKLNVEINRRVRNLVIYVIVMLSAIPIYYFISFNFYILIVFFSVMLYAYVNMFNNKVNTYKFLVEKFENDTRKYRQKWMNESFKNASEKTYSKSRVNTEEEDWQKLKKEYDDFITKQKRDREEYKKRQQDYYNHYRSSENFSKGYDINRDNSQRGTFKDCITVKDVKRVYKMKAKKHHPDVGGDAETFKALTIQYERALKIAQRK